MTSTTFLGRTALLYIDAGFVEPFPLPKGRKSPPPADATGNRPASSESAVLERLTSASGSANLGVRMPHGLVVDGVSTDVIGLDVDHHDDKHGGDTLAALELRYGVLPTTWRNSARGVENSHGHHFYRVPAGRKWRGQVGPGVETIQPNHRYSVVAPSVVDGRTYRWYLGERPVEGGTIPQAADLPALPKSWVEFMDAGKSTAPRPLSQEVVTADVAKDWLECALPGYGELPSGEMTSVADPLKLARAALVGAHEMVATKIHQVIMLGVEGHHGCEWALDNIQTAFFEEVLGKSDGIARRSLEDARGEYSRALVGAVRKVKRDIDEGLNAVATTPITADDTADFDALEAVRITIDQADTAPIRIYAKGADSEVDSARYCAEHYRGTIGYLAEETGTFMVWNGSRHVEHRDNTAVRALWNAFRHRLEIMSGQGDAAECDWKTPGGGLSYANHVAESMKEFEVIHVRASDYDSNPHELNTPAGIVDLKACTLRPHDPTARHTRITEVSPDFDAAPPKRFLSWLRLVTKGDDAMISYLQWVYGQALLGERGAEHLYLLFGAGGSGKSKMQDAVTGVLGLGATGYAHRVSGRFLMETRTPAHQSELADLKGRRFLVVSELPSSGLWNTDRFKTLTGDHDLTASKKGLDSETFRLAATVVIDTNHFPGLPEVTKAERRRIRALPFEYDFVSNTGDDGPDAEFMNKLLSYEGPAIAAWLCRGARAYLAQQKPTLPDRAQVLTDQLLLSNDIVAQFVEDECTLIAEGVESNAHVFAAFEDWSRSQGLPRRSQKWLMPQLRDKYGVVIDYRPDGGRRFTQGLMLNSTPQTTIKVSLNQSSGEA